VRRVFDVCERPDLQLRRVLPKQECFSRHPEVVTDATEHGCEYTLSLHKLITYNPGDNPTTAAFATTTLAFVHEGYIECVRVYRKGKFCFNLI
jgi:hypothetical protein